MRWFKKEKPGLTRPSQPLDYPEGMAVDTEKAVYYIKNKKRFRFFSDRVFESWNLEPAIGSEASVKHIPRGGVLGFRDGSLIQDFSDGKIYLIAGNKRRLITSPDVFDLLGYDEGMIVPVSREEVELHDRGGDIAWRTPR